MREDGYPCDLARELAPDALGRFLRYARIDTQADPESDTVPSTAKQLELSRLLVEELRALGLDDAELDDQGYVLATLAGTVEGEVPAIALLAHVDVSPDAPATGIEPQVVRYEGGRLPLPGDPAVALDPERSPELLRHVGHELVTSHGTTLLGADDKAGIAAIMAGAGHLLRHPELERGPVRICFTRDEEIGRGTDGLDLERLGAVAAYTLDGSTAGEIEDETFSALEATVRFRGVAAHPGSAKGQLVNALKVAADFVASLPRDRLSPETTADREGFLHPRRVSGSEEECTVIVILRDFDGELLRGHEELLRRLADEAAAAHRGSAVEVEVAEQYRNMKEVLDEHPFVVEAAQEATRRAGLEPKLGAARGGTDGSRLSERGLPTPNVFTGGQDYHSRHEWLCVADLGAAAATVVELVQVWAERQPPG